MLRIVSGLWPLVVLAISGIAVAIALVLPDGHPVMMSIAALAGAAFGSFDSVVLLLALLFGLVIRHLVIAVAIAAALGFLLQFFSSYGFHEDAAVAIIARSIALLIGMAAVGIIPLVWRTVRGGRAFDTTPPTTAVE